MRGLILATLLAATPLAAQDFPTGSHRHAGANAVIREVGAGAIGSFAGLLPVMLVPSCFEHTHFNATIDCREPLVVGAWLGGVAGGVAGIALANAMDRSGPGPR